MSLNFRREIVSAMLEVLILAVLVKIGALSASRSWQDTIVTAIVVTVLIRVLARIIGG